MAKNEVSYPKGLQVHPIETMVKKLHYIAPHSHDFYELLYLTKGRTRIKIRGRSYEAVAGDLVIYSPQETHEEFVQKGPFAVVCLRFPAEFVHKPMTFPGTGELEPVMHLPWPERFQSLFTLMLEENQLQDQFSRLMLGAHLLQFTILVRRALSHLAEGQADRDTDASKHIQNAVNLIHESLESDLSLTDLAKRAYMSESYFSHTFKNITGESPKRYLIKTRMLKAKGMLVSHNESIKEIAAKMGYEDPHHFSRVFKRTLGLSPSAYRKKNRKSHP